MSISIPDLKSDLNGLIDELKGMFLGFNFNTKDGLTLDDLDDIEGFEKFAVAADTSTAIKFSQFQKKLSPSLYSEDEDIPKSAFDWDEVEEIFDTTVTAYNNYRSASEQVNDNLTGNQTVDDVILHDESELKNLLLQYAIDSNLVYEINVDGETHYLPSQQLQDKI